MNTGSIIVTVLLLLIVYYAVVICHDLFIAKAREGVTAGDKETEMDISDEAAKYMPVEINREWGTPPFSGQRKKERSEGVTTEGGMEAGKLKRAVGEKTAEQIENDLDWVMITSMNLCA